MIEVIITERPPRKYFIEDNPIHIVLAEVLYKEIQTWDWEDIEVSVEEDIRRIHEA